MIETQVRQHLIHQAELTPFMATYNGEMAVFNQEAPADTSKGWGDGSQYGRIVFYLDMQDDPQRNISGTMGIDLYCESGKQIPEEIEPILRSLIDGYFFSNAFVTISTKWRSTQYFTDPTEKVIGATLIFDILDFPNQLTTDPDPIKLLNNWTILDVPNLIGATNVFVIGKDELPAAWKPTNEIPAVYWRIGEIKNCSWIPDTYACSWETATIWGHVMAADDSTAVKIARVIQNTLITKRRLIFDDMAPLMIDKNIGTTPANDPMRVGIINIEATYGILNIQPPCDKVNHIYTNRKEFVNGDTKRETDSGK